MIMVYAARQIKARAVSTIQPVEVESEVFVEMLSRYKELRFGNPKRPELPARQALYFIMKDRAGTIVKHHHSDARRISRENDVSTISIESPSDFNLSEFVRTVEHAIEYAALLKKLHLRTFLEHVLWSPEKLSLEASGLNKYQYFDARGTAKGILVICLREGRMNQARSRAHGAEDGDALAVLEAWDRGFVRPQDVADVTGLPLFAIAAAVKRILHRMTGRD
jgi:hypothetical protein